MTRFEACDAQEALTELSAASAKFGAEAEIISVDQAIAALMAGDMSASESGLHKVRQQMDHLRQKDVTEQTRSVLTDDNGVSWSGREFEQRMVDNLLVLTSLVGDRQDAFAYTSQLEQKVHSDQVDLQPEEPAHQVVVAGHSDAVRAPPPPPARLNPNALAAYLQALVHSEHTLNGELTDRAIQQVSYWTEGRPPINAAFGTQTQRDHGTLHVITFAGRVTDWSAETAAPTSAALLIADRIISAVGDHTLPPTIAPVKIARPNQQFSMHPFVTTVQLVGPPGITGPPLSSQTVADLNAAAWDSYQNDRDEQLARAVARRIVKKASVYAAKNQLSVTGNTGVDLVMNLGGIAWEALEKPDIRHITLLPERIEVVQMELPVGDHQVNVQSARRNYNGTVGHSQSGRITDVRIENGRNTVVLCFRPSDNNADAVIITQQ